MEATLNSMSLQIIIIILSEDVCHIGFLISGKYFAHAKVDTEPRSRPDKYWRN
jgi:hypothetical protein